jgi:molybdenum cofactor cytidylyltransferase
MRFGPVPVARAEGAVLAHALALPGGVLKKGQVLKAADLAAIADGGITEVIVAQLDGSEVAEDAAAAALAAALLTPGLRAGSAATGRVNLYATGPGVLVVEAAAVGRINAVHPMITLATLPAFARVQDRAMVATVKIIAYGVPATALAAAVAAAPGALGRAAPGLTTATLIETVIDGRDPGAKGRAAMATRLERLDCRLTPPVRVAHAAGPLSAAMAAAPGQIVLILTASATSDPGDVVPAAIEQSGGRVIRFGMPVDPGNLLVLGQIGDRPVIGLPGCARSPALNGADWVLERLICGVSVTAADIAAMGVGGLLKEMPSRPRRREANKPD